MAKNQFDRPKFHEHAFVTEDGKYVGTIRIKPNKIMWAKPNAKKWKAVDLEAFARWITEAGRDQNQ